jgi:hypothetical protein
LTAAPSWWWQRKRSGRPSQISSLSDANAAGGPKSTSAMNNAQPALDHTVGCPSLIAQQLATTPMHALAGLFPTSSLFCSPGSDQNGVRRAEQLLRTMDKLKFADALDWIATGRDKISPATASKMMADRIRKFLFRRLVLQLSKTQPNIPRRGFFGSALSIRVMSDYGWRPVAQRGCSYANSERITATSPASHSWCHGNCSHK